MPNGIDLGYKNLKLNQGIIENNVLLDRLRESENKYRELVENLNDVVYSVSNEGKITYVSPSVESIIGYTDDELIGRPFGELLHIDDQAMVSEAFMDVLHNKLKPTEYRIRSKSNEFRWVRTSSSPIYSNGRVTGLQGVLTDITERKQAEEALVNEKNLSEAIIESIPGMLYVYDDQGNHIRHNKRHEEMTGYSAEELSHLNPLSWYDDKADILRVESAINDVFAKGYGQVEAPMRIKNGEKLMMHFTGSKLVMNGKKYFVGVGTDITDRKQAEEALRESEEKYRTILETIPDPVVAYNSQHKITYINEAFERTYGWSKNELINREIDFVPPEEVENTKEAWQRTLAGEKVFFETKRKTKDGRLLDIQLRTAILNDRFGNHLVSIVIHRDISERKRLEALLQQAHKMELVGTLAGGIAHDYNNLLAAIIGNISMAREETAPHSVMAELLHEAEQASLKARDLTHQFFTLSQGGHPIKGLGSIGNLLREIPERVQARDGIEYTFSIQNDLWPVLYDPKQMGHSISNLLMNAVEAMPQGGCITIQAENQFIENKNESSEVPFKEGKYVRISIKDEGRGIPEEHLDRIFDPYFSTKDRGVQKGMGLGLASAYAIVQKHGGRIVVHSKTGLGTTVTIYLPAAEEKREEESAKQKSDDIGLSTSSVQTTIKRILFMDDEESLRNLAQKMLERLGYEVETVKDGVEATLKYKEQMDSGEPFDAVILDLTIKGGMGGDQAIKELIKIDPDVKAIVSSGYFNDPIITNFKEYGFQGAMPKPYQKVDLETVLKKVLG